MPPMKLDAPSARHDSRGVEEPGSASRGTERVAEDADRIGRRGFLGALGISVALAGTAGCRRAVERVVPYTTSPEEIIPGVPTHFATVYARRGDALGLVIESHEGRPTKVEGNPGHPSSLGATDLIAQASILDLYDPDRSPSPSRHGANATWDAATGEIAAALATHAKDGGAKLRVLMEPSNSPSVLRLRAAFLARFPKARVHAYAPVNDSHARAGATLAYGKPLNVLPHYDKAKVIVSIDADFLQTEPGNVRAHKLYSKGRRVGSPRDGMSRLYVVESHLTTTGANADHRLRLAPSTIEPYAVALAAHIAAAGVSFGALEGVLRKAQAPDAIPSKWLGAVAKDLVANRGASLVVVGSSQPPRVHALAHAINHALGNVGATVDFVDVTDPAEPDNATDLAALTNAIAAGSVDTLVILGGNPVYDAPADLAFGDRLAKVALSVHLGSFDDETSAKCTWHLPRAHELEAWGDQRALDGTLAIQQPLIAPLFDGKSDLELLAILAAAPEKKAYDAVRVTLAAPLLAAATHVAVADHDWKRALRDGVATHAPLEANLTLRVPEIVAALERAPLATFDKSKLEVAFVADAKMLDGRHANNSWLQEMPDPITKIAWDNAALLSPGTAKALGVESGDVVRLSRGGRAITIAAWVVPGVAERTLVLPLGWGRTRAGMIGNLRGFDVYPLRTTDALSFAADVDLVKTGQRHELAQTQHHDSMEGRPIICETTLAEYRKEPHFPQAEAPPQRSLPLWRDQDYSKGHQWGMSIDLNACTGCSACVVACQAENNVPVVGKPEVLRGREMHWLRMDRYFVDDEALGALPEAPLVSYQPVACVQCEEAPCENVCPVTATLHSSEGLSEVVYNRCVGTRYCANNCPYKVRRFNYLNWHNDGVWKISQGLPETLQMQHNPNVTVRSRGVIEKCTYCVQRIQESRIKATRAGGDMKDGDIVTACQQVCPGDAIVFGDLNDMKSKVAKLSMADRRYALLEELGTKPRTTYLGKIRNPNPEMA